MWSWLRDQVLQKWQLDLNLHRANVLVWMSPPCTTFSKADSSNRNRRNRHGLKLGYRNHHKKARPPMRTVRGQLAVQDDKLVQQWLGEVLTWGVDWIMENPVGSLVRRPYMKKLLKGHKYKLERVDYCAYGRLDKKPTHVWTSLVQWQPRGTTTTGLCAGRGKCTGMQGNQHTTQVTGGRKRCVPGKGAVSAKSAVPEMLMDELRREWKRSRCC